MSHRHLVFLLALMCLATTIAPAVADTPTMPRAGASPTVYDDVREGRPGAMLAMQMQLIQRMWTQASIEYYAQCGKYPTDTDAAIAAGMVPFLPEDAHGQPWPVIQLDDAELPPTVTMGIRLRSNDHTFIAMGADGDPLAPLIKSLQLSPQRPAWPVEYPWRARMAESLQRGVIAQFQAYVSLTGESPKSPADLQDALQLVPTGGTWRLTSPGPDLGIQVDTDATGRLFRFTGMPNPAKREPQYLQVAAGPPATLKGVPLQVASQVDWRPWGILDWDSPFPENLDHWTPPSATPKSPDPRYGPRQATHLGLDQLAESMRTVGAWYLVNAKRPPTIEELLQHRWELHDALDHEGEPLVPVAADLTSLWGATPDWDAGINIRVGAIAHLPSGLLVDCDSTRVHVFWDQPPVVPPPSDARVDGAGGRSVAPAHWTMKGGEFAQRQSWWDNSSAGQQPFAPIADEAAAALQFWYQHPESATPSLHGMLWSALSHSDQHFDYIILELARDTMEVTAEKWLVAHPDAPGFPEWSTVLQDLRLAPHGYSIIAPGAAPPAGQGRITIEYAPQPGYLRFTTVHPNGVRFVWYDGLSGVDRVEQGGNFLRDAFSDPEIVVLGYQHVVTIALPIPEPPVLPEVSTP